MTEWMNEWMNKWINERMNEWMTKSVNDWIHEWMNEWMNEWVNGFMNESCIKHRTNERIIERTKEWMITPKWPVLTNKPMQAKHKIELKRCHLNLIIVQ